MRRLDLSLLLSLAVFGSAGAVRAQSCQTYPYNLTNGSTADATQVMANFNCAALTGAGSFTGQVGVDTTTPTDTLDVNGQVVLGPTGGERLSFNTASIGFNRHVTDGQIYTNAAYAYQFQHFGNLTNTSDYLTIQVYSPSGASIMNSALTINGAGNVGVHGVSPSYAFYVNGTAAGTGTWINASDARLKRDVRPITDALSMVERLHGVRFWWRPVEDRPVGKSLSLPLDEPQMGFIAQDVAKVAPEAVSTPKEGTDEIYGLKEGSLIAVLVEAVKEQQSEIEQLKAKLTAMTPVK